MASDPLEQFDGISIDGLAFCAMTYALFNQVRNEPGGTERLRARKGVLAKRLQGELLPICRYVQTYYRLGRFITIRWVNGSQTYDAELHQRGELVDHGYYSPQAYLEVTCAMHDDEHHLWELLNQGDVAFAPEGVQPIRGQPLHSKPVVFDHDEHVQKFLPLVLSSIRTKAAKGYPDETSLVVQCHLNSLYTPPEWHSLTHAVEQELRGVPFKEILLFDAATQRATSLSWVR